MNLQNLNLFNDAMFKSLFRSIEAREMVYTFLSRITGIDEELLKKAEYVGGELPKKNIQEKGKIADVIIKLKDRNTIVLEMNQHSSKNSSEKNTSDDMDVLIDSINCPKIYKIHIDNYNRFKTKEPILYFKFRDEFGHVVTEKYVSIYLITENILSQNYNGDKEIQKTVKFLNTKELKDLEKDFGKEEKYMAAIRSVKDLSTDPNFIGYYDEKEAIAWDLEDMRLTGIDEGENKKQQEIVKNMLKENFDTDMICKITGLTEEELNIIKEKIKG